MGGVFMSITRVVLKLTAMTAAAIVNGIFWATMLPYPNSVIISFITGIGIGTAGGFWLLEDLK